MDRIADIHDRKSVPSRYEADPNAPPVTAIILNGQTVEDFGMPLFKEPGTIVAIELGGRQDGSLSCANDNSFYATLPQHAAWIHSQIPDTDGDGTPDECDICPGTDDAQVANASRFVVTGIAPAPNHDDGQFVQMDVLSVTLVP